MEVQAHNTLDRVIFDGMPRQSAWAESPVGRRVKAFQSQTKSLQMPTHDLNNAGHQLFHIPLAFVVDNSEHAAEVLAFVRRFLGDDSIFYGYVGVCPAFPAISNEQGDVWLLSLCSKQWKSKSWEQRESPIRIDWSEFTQ